MATSKEDQLFEKLYLLVVFSKKAFDKIKESGKKEEIDDCLNELALLTLKMNIAGANKEKFQSLYALQKTIEENRKKSLSGHYFRENVFDALGKAYDLIASSSSTSGEIFLKICEDIKESMEKMNNRRIQASTSSADLPTDRSEAPNIDDEQIDVAELLETLLKQMAQESIQSDEEIANAKTLFEIYDKASKDMPKKVLAHYLEGNSLHEEPIPEESFVQDTDDTIPPIPKHQNRPFFFKEEGNSDSRQDSSAPNPHQKKS